MAALPKGYYFFSMSNDVFESFANRWAIYWPEQVLPHPTTIKKPVAACLQTAPQSST